MSVIEDILIHMAAALIAVIAAVIALAILLFIVVIPLNFIDRSVQPNVEVFVQKELVYKGTNACVDVSSSGDTTTVKTKRFYCILPHKTYTSKDVVVRTVE